MGGVIYLVQDDGGLVEMRESAYDAEDLLQMLLEKYPDLLAGEQMNSAEPRRWLFISRETPVSSEEGGAWRWSLDHLFLDQDGIPTLVEVKRSSDTRIRREVVGQMLDYAANAVAYWPVESIRARFEADHEDSEALLAVFLGGEADQESYWEKVKTNLQAGRIRLVFVADEIPPELRSIVEFLNRQMNPAEVLAVEIKQYAGKGLKSLVPRVLGQILDTPRRRPGGNQWDKESILSELKSKRSADEAEITEKILAWADTEGLKSSFGKGSVYGSFFPMLDHRGESHYLFAVWTNGFIELQFEWMRRKAPFSDKAKRLELRQRLNAIPGVAITDAAIDRRPGIRLSTLKENEALSQFLEAFHWAVQEIRSPRS